MRQANRRARASRRILILALATAVAACQPFAALRGAEDAALRPVQRPEPGTVLLDRDVEAPEIYRSEAEALWDGRPSLGGIWVAAPEVTSPERVIMRNPSNGEEVVGALFRRERITPGPALQLSSEAAVALGILAGAPTRIEVVALRQVEPAPVAAATPPVEAATDDAAGTP